jgi:predicted DNA-binding transcriptional regulator AlpA
MTSPHEPARPRRDSLAQPLSTDDMLIDIVEVRRIFHIGRTAAYELTHRRGFPAPVLISPRCYRWWASEVAAFAASLPRDPARAAKKAPASHQVPDSAVSPGKITGSVRVARTRGKAS